MLTKIKATSYTLKMNDFLKYYIWYTGRDDVVEMI